ncbi:uncharacterized protein LOC129574267 [Sitodiplosis mosellana]|uniref:uncharacterized protein LOC129574267 n=1 Tax=Sitodiplosis mosellana TaxID=263140 RepID=UPI00244518F4|nr:uncharacterized protein LOC129574267 [Sitodiplosis mosellana]
MAYYVVYLLEKQKYVIVPATWVKDIKDHYEKFINNSLNRSQTFLCFYPDDSSPAFIDGCPSENFAPNFHSVYCFMGKLKRYFERYGDAQSHMQHMRNVKPPVYNQRRLTELPIPDVSSQTSAAASTNSNIHDSNSSDDSFGDDDHSEYDLSLHDDEITDEAPLNEVNNGQNMNDMGPLSDQALSTENVANEEVEINETNNGHDINDDMDPLGDSLSLTENGAVDNASMNETTNPQSMNDTHSSLSNPKSNETPSISTEGMAGTTSDENTANNQQSENDQSIGHLQIVAVESLAKSASDENSDHDSDALVGAQSVTESTGDETIANEAAPSHATAPESSRDVQSDPIEHTVEPENDESGAHISESISLNTACVVKAEYVPLFNIHSVNNAAIDELLDDEPEEVICEDDVVMLIGQSGVPLPMASTKDELIKRENDPISGNTPFNEKRDGRVYKIGKRYILIPKKAVDKMSEWNTGLKRDDIRYDKKFCQALLLSLVDKQQLKQSIVDADVMQFIRDCFAIRCVSNEEERIASIEKLKDDICCEQAMNSNQ